jgi:hypothetical protein
MLKLCGLSGTRGITGKASPVKGDHERKTYRVIEEIRQKMDLFARIPARRSLDWLGAGEKLWRTNGRTPFPRHGGRRIDNRPRRGGRCGRIAVPGRGRPPGMGAKDPMIQFVEEPGSAGQGRVQGGFRSQRRPDSVAACAREVCLGIASTLAGRQAPRLAVPPDPQCNPLIEPSERNASSCWPVTGVGEHTASG